MREEYLSHLETEGLLDVEAASPGGGFKPVADVSGASARYRGNPSPQPSSGGSRVGLTPPPYPWPPWPNPSMAGFGPRGGRRYTPGSGSALSREGLTFPPDEWPPWPWPPWPWPGPYGGDPIPFPASRW